MKNILREHVEKLLAARSEVELLRARLYVAESKYKDAEEAFFPDEASFNVGDPLYPINIVFGDTLIMPVEDWWKKSMGRRLQFHKVAANFTFSELEKPQHVVNDSTNNETNAVNPLEP